jgi:hypothetical protein
MAEPACPACQAALASYRAREGSEPYGRILGALARLAALETGTLLGAAIARELEVIEGAAADQEAVSLQLASMVEEGR